MANYLDKGTLKDQIDTAEKHMKPYFEPFQEYERLARNKPHPKVLALKLPNVTDGRLAAATFKQPKRTIQQLPTGLITNKQFPELGEIINYDWQNNIIPHAKTNGNVLLKSWAISTKALTYGYQPSYQFITTNGTYTGGDFRLPYVKDVLLPQGTIYGPDAKTLFLVSWWTKSDVTFQLDKTKKLSEQEADTKGWQPDVLQELLAAMERKTDDNRSAAEREKNDDSRFIKLVSCFQYGIGGEFYMFSPKLDKVVRTWTNLDPRGQMPIKFMYADIDLSNPTGRGNIEIAGGMQNLLDSEMQAYQFMQRLMMNPPVQKWGNSVVMQSVKWKPNAIWDMGSDANSKLEPVQMNTQALSNFTNNYGLIASEIDQLVGASVNTVSGTSGNPSASKTPAGVQQANSNLSVDDNFLRKQYEAWYEDMANDVINLTYTQKSADETIELDKTFLDKLPDDFKSKAVTIDAKAGTGTIKYGSFKEAMQFTVDPSSSSKQDDAQQVETLTNLLGTIENNPLLQSVVPPEKILATWNSIVDASGTENPEDLRVTPEEYQQHQQEQQAQAQQAQQAEAQANQPAPQPTENKEIPDGNTIYSKTTDPSIRTQLEVKAGLAPDTENTINEMDTNEAQHAANQASAMQTADPTIAPQSAQDTNQEDTNGNTQSASQPESSDQTQSQDDPELMQAFQQAGFTPEEAQYGMQLHQAGYSDQEIMHILAQAMQGAQ